MQLDWATSEDKTQPGKRDFQPGKGSYLDWTVEATRQNAIFVIFFSQASALTAVAITMKQASLCRDSAWFEHLLFRF